MRCGVTRKVGFRTQNGALNRAAEIMQEDESGESNRRKQPMGWRAYHCIYCNGWHLTSKVLQFRPRKDTSSQIFR